MRQSGKDARVCHFMRIIFQTDVPSFQINRTKDEDELARRTSASAERSLAFVQR
ncbi:Hypothetical protein SMAX5B_019500 [Scophthalmus maximus]|uniref:Uncharacterized protein n=1 Tax=Scophthalmus maximus TaxID=52904 RepID=A0A2U9BIQ1_SCOMX|nr:Hypothetical protein SMAX5B_019500 [Scophthalmus maximus]